MRKISSFALVLTLGAILISGCQQAQQPAPTSNIPANAIATDLGIVAKNSLAIDNNILDAIKSLSVQGIKATKASTPEYSGGWWSSTDSYSYGGFTYNYNYNFKVWNRSGSEITTHADLSAISGVDDVSKIWLYVEYTCTASGYSYSMKYGGSKDNPLKFEGYNTTNQNLSGPISYSSSYNGENFEIVLTYSSISLTSSGYPNGSVNFSVVENGSEVFAGSIAYDGDNTATITFTKGASGTYTVNLDDGLVTSSL